MCYITKWHCGSKMCYQWGICVTNVLPLDKISLTIVLKKVVYFADYKHITLPLNATILIPYCVTTDPMRITKWKGFCYEFLSFLYTLLLYSIRIYNYIYCLFSTILLKSSDKIVTNVIVCQIRTDIIPFALLLFASISQPFLSYFSIF